MSKAKASPKQAEQAPAAKNYLPWPAKDSEYSARPRLFRIHRLNAYEWQAYVTMDGYEHPMGKPDTFALVMQKARTVMGVEGQIEYLTTKHTNALKHVN